MQLHSIISAVIGLNMYANVQPWQPSRKTRPGKLGAGWMHKRLMRHFAEKSLERQIKSRRRVPLVDQHGNYTEAGRDPLRRIDADGRQVRRKWLAGISAQRGY